MNEFGFIRWVREQTHAHAGVPVGPGDDCAVVNDSAGNAWLLTTDMLMEGVDFYLDEAGPRRVGHKALAVNLSDIAAMGGQPRWALVSLALPMHNTQVIAEELYRGLTALAKTFDVALVGGDTNTWNQGLVISVTLCGQPGPQGPMLRSGAKPGDWLLATGPFGGSILGHHLDFTPRVREGLALQDHARLHALIDVSDGLAADVNHLAEESGCGIVLNAEMIPIAPAAFSLGDRRPPLEHALADGEDFELVFAVAPAEGANLIAQQPIAGIQLAKIGACVAERGLFLEEQGQRRPLEPIGFVHRFA